MRTVLITAGASGIGHAMACAFEAAGYRVWIADIDAAALEAVPASWQARRCDARDEPAIAALIAEIGPLDVLCANAGIAGPTAPVEEVALADWAACLSVNLDAAFLAAKHATPGMKAQGGGAMILTSSTAGLYGFPNRAPYAAAKWGVIGLMKTLAMELGPFGIRANAICPGAVEGPRMTGVMEREARAKGTSFETILQGYRGANSMRGLISARDVAEMAVFLGSDAGRMVSGQTIAVDGHTENPDPRV